MLLTSGEDNSTLNKLRQKFIGELFRDHNSRISQQIRGEIEVFCSMVLKNFTRIVNWPLKVLVSSSVTASLLLSTKE